MVKQHRKRRRGKRGAEPSKESGRGLDLLWGTHQRAARGPKPALSMDAVVDAAVEIVDSDGLNALTMAKVAAYLQVTTMAIYRYVPSKEELVDLMIDSAFGAAPIPGGGDWRTETARWARADLALFRSRPWLLETILRRESMGPNWLAWLNAAIAALSGTTLNSSEKFAVATLVDGHSRSAAQILLGATGQWAKNFDRVLRMTISDPRYAAIAAVVSEGSTDDQDDVEAQIMSQFEFGLDRLLDGVQSYLDASSNKSTRKPNTRSRVSRGRE